MNKKVKPSSVLKKETKTRGRQPVKGGRNDKVALISTLLKEGKSRGEILNILEKKWPKISLKYASTLIQSTRKSLGFTGRTKIEKTKKENNVKKIKKQSVKKVDVKTDEITKPVSEDKEEKNPANDIEDWDKQ